MTDPKKPNPMQQTSQAVTQNPFPATGLIANPQLYKSPVPAFDPVTMVQKSLGTTPLYDINSAIERDLATPAWQRSKDAGDPFDSTGWNAKELAMRSLPSQGSYSSVDAYAANPELLAKLKTARPGQTTGWTPQADKSYGYNQLSAKRYMAETDNRINPQAGTAYLNAQLFADQAAKVYQILAKNPGDIPHINQWVELTKQSKAWEAQGDSLLTPAIKTVTPTPAAPAPTGERPTAKAPSAPAAPAPEAPAPNPFAGFKVPTLDTSIVSPEALRDASLKAEGITPPGGQ